MPHVSGLEWLPTRTASPAWSGSLPHCQIRVGRVVRRGAVADAYTGADGSAAAFGSSRADSARGS